MTGTQRANEAFVIVWPSQSAMHDIKFRKMISSYNNRIYIAEQRQILKRRKTIEKLMRNDFQKSTQWKKMGFWFGHHVTLVAANFCRGIFMVSSTT
jgi:hypothetical protein